MANADPSQASKRARPRVCRGLWTAGAGDHPLDVEPVAGILGPEIADAHGLRRDEVAVAFRPPHARSVPTTLPCPGRWNGRTIQDDLAAKGIPVKGRSARGIADEAPEACGDAGAAVPEAERAGLMRRLARLPSIAWIKG